MQIANWTFEAGPQTAAHARTAMVGSLSDLREESMEIAVLLTGELVANAVLHGTGAVGVHLALDQAGLRVEVKDNSPEWPVVRALDPDAPNGRGLRLVDGLASDWGVNVGATGKTVWFSHLDDRSTSGGFSRAV